MRKHMIRITMISALCCIFLFMGQADWDDITIITADPISGSPGDTLTLTANKDVFVEDGYLLTDGGTELSYSYVSPTMAITTFPYLAEGETSLSLATASVEVSVEPLVGPPGGWEPGEWEDYLRGVFTRMDEIQVEVNNTLTKYLAATGYAEGSEEYKVVISVMEANAEEIAEQAAYFRALDEKRGRIGA